jgi:hypothetical protein
MRKGRHARTGTEPVTALSDLPLRLLLAALFTPLFVAGTVLLAVWWYNAEPGGAVSRTGIGAATLICAAVSLFAVTDLLVVARRLRRARASRHGR